MPARTGWAGWPPAETSWRTINEAFAANGDDDDRRPVSGDGARMRLALYSALGLELLYG